MMLPSAVGARVALVPDWHALMEPMASLGRMQVWVGNPAASLVRSVIWDEVVVQHSHIDFVGEGVHARLDLEQCGGVFAGECAGPSSTPLVLSVIDHVGASAMEFRFPARSRQGFETLVRAYRVHDRPSGGRRAPIPCVARPNDDIDVAALRQQWDQLGRCRSMHALLDEFGVTFGQCCRLAGGSRVRRLSADMAHARLLAAEEQRIPSIIRVHSRAATAAHIGRICATRSMGSQLHLYACCGFGASLSLSQLRTGWDISRPGVTAASRSLEFVDDDDGRLLTVAFPGDAFLDYL